MQAALAISNELVTNTNAAASIEKHAYMDSVLPTFGLSFEDKKTPASAAIAKNKLYQPWL